MNNGMGKVRSAAVVLVLTGRIDRGIFGAGSLFLTASVPAGSTVAARAGSATPPLAAGD
jgi:hypothetical protein